MYTDDPDHQVIVITVTARITGGKEPGKDRPERNEVINEFEKLYHVAD
ncbi:MAG TPA: hypothetical protein PK926_16890 [Spirochaetota bacterium]|nr:hypothetical protein [Spirochaetota bacterium]HPI89496.1 hypothetical protein [Spirochaetota bacterium]HPR49569.1 hypothetical protein [Spirochaetota bacterium]